MTNGVHFLCFLSREPPRALTPRARSLYVSLTASPWNPWINNSRHRFFTLWLNMIFIPFSILPPTQLCEEAHKTLFISSPESHLRYIYIFFFYLLPLLDHLLSPQNVVSAQLDSLCFRLSTHPLFPSLFPFAFFPLSHPLGIVPWIWDSDKLWQESQRSRYLSASQ